VKRLNTFVSRPLGWAGGVAGATLLFALLDGLTTAQDVSSDGVAYLDIASQLRGHAWHGIVNGYWNPGYPVVLALAGAVTRASLPGEYALAHWVNFLLLVGMMAALWFFVGMLRPAKGQADTWTESDGGRVQLSRHTLLATAAIGVLNLLEPAFSVAQMTPDVLLAIFFFVACGLLMRVQRTGGASGYVGFGLAMGLGYLVKSAFFPLTFLALLLMVFLRRRLRLQWGGIALTAAAFVFVVMPHVTLLSEAKGHFSYGESGRLNYLWLVDGVDNEDRLAIPSADAENAAAIDGKLKHAPVTLAENPRIEMFATPVAGTFPLWTDVTYWEDGVTVPLRPMAQVRRLILNGLNLLETIGLAAALAMLVAGFLLLTGMRGGGGTARAKRFEQVPWLVLGVALLQIGLYCVVEADVRYLAASLLVVMLSVLASLRFKAENATPVAVGSLIGAVAIGTLCLMLPGEKTELVHALKGHSVGIRHNPYIGAVQALQTVAKPGDTVACLGIDACNDSYWVRAAGLKYSAFVDLAPAGAGAFRAMDGARQDAILERLRRAKIDLLTVQLAPGMAAPAGWVAMGDGQRYVLRIDVVKEIPLN
jgi:Dolichyl-phosphate-mannose-protein mannosyltransferase